MNQKEFIAKIAEEQGVTKKFAGEAVNAFLKGIDSICRNGEDVTFVGRFSVYKDIQKARTGQLKHKQPDGSMKFETWTTDDHEVMKIRISKTLKEAFNNVEEEEE